MKNKKKYSYPCFLMRQKRFDGVGNTSVLPSVSSLCFLFFFLLCLWLLMQDILGKQIKERIS